MPRNYDDVVLKLIEEAECEGYWPESINDSEETLKVKDSTTKPEMVEWATAADEAVIRFGNDDGDKFTVYLVYGNMKDETINDYSAKEVADRICTLVAKHFEGQ